MGFDDCYQLGYLVKTHGLKGEIVAQLDVDYPEYYSELESVLIDKDGKLVPFFLESIAIQSNKAFVAFEDVDNIDEAAKLVGLSLYLPTDRLPKLPEGKYYYHQLIGMNLLNGNEVIGEVTQFYDLPNNKLLGVDHSGNEVLIPLNDDIIKSVDLNKKVIITELPEGLVDVFLDQS